MLVPVELDNGHIFHYLILELIALLARGLAVPACPYFRTFHLSARMAVDLDLLHVGCETREEQEVVRVLEVESIRNFQIVASDELGVEEHGLGFSALICIGIDKVFVFRQAKARPGLGFVERSLEGPDFLVLALAL